MYYKRTKMVRLAKDITLEQWDLVKDRRKQSLYNTFKRSIVDVYNYVIGINWAMVLLASGTVYLLINLIK